MIPLLSPLLSSCHHTSKILVAAKSKFSSKGGTREQLGSFIIVVWGLFHKPSIRLGALRDLGWKVKFLRRDFNLNIEVGTPSVPSRFPLGEGAVQLPRWSDLVHLVTNKAAEATPLEGLLTPKRPGN